MSELIGGD